MKYRNGRTAAAGDRVVGFTPVTLPNPNPKEKAVVIYHPLAGQVVSVGDNLMILVAVKPGTVEEVPTQNCLRTDDLAAITEPPAVAVEPPAAPTPN